MCRVYVRCVARQEGINRSIWTRQAFVRLGNRGGKIQGRNNRVTVLDVFSWLPAKEISIEELEQIFIGHLNGTYEGEPPIT